MCVGGGGGFERTPYGSSCFQSVMQYLVSFLIGKTFQPLCSAKILKLGMQYCNEIHTKDL